MSMKYGFKINNVEYYPKSMKLKYETLASENSGRTEDGIMHISYLRPKLRKLEITLPPFSASDLTSKWKNLLDYVYANTNIQVTFYDVTTDSYQTFRAYCSNFNGEMYNGVVFDGMWQGITFSLIEV